MYPLNMALKVGVGFAVANDEAEHKALNEAGYGPEFFIPGEVGTSVPEEDIDAIRKQLDERGIKYHPRAGIEKLKALL